MQDTLQLKSITTYDTNSMISDTSNSPDAWMSFSCPVNNEAISTWDSYWYSNYNDRIYRYKCAMTNRFTAGRASCTWSGYTYSMDNTLPWYYVS
jgi:hypothetical protein